MTCWRRFKNERRTPEALARVKTKTRAAADPPAGQQLRPGLAADGLLCRLRRLAQAVHLARRDRQGDRRRRAARGAQVLRADRRGRTVASR